MRTGRAFSRTCSDKGGTIVVSLHSIVVARRAGKWAEVSQLDNISFVRIIQQGPWSKNLIDQVTKYGWIEDTSVG